MRDIRLAVSILAPALALGLLGAWAFDRHVLAQGHANTNSFVFGDVFGLYYPMLTFAAASLREGHVPLWNPFQLGGIPSLATLYTGVLYPFHFPYLFLPVHRAMLVVTVMHILLAGWMAALYATVALGVGRLAALAAGIVFMFCTYTLWSSFGINQLTSLPWIPLLFLSVDQAIRSPRPGWALGIAAAIALPILGGNLQVLSYEAYAIIPYALACLWEAFRQPNARRAIRRGLLVLVAGGLLGLAVAAPQWVPTLELSTRSSRPPGGLTLSQIDPVPLPPPSAREWLEGRRLTNGFIFPGVVVFLPACFAFLSRRSPARILALTTIGVLAALVSLGPHEPIGREFMRLPMGTWFRGFSRAWPLTQFALSTLAAAGLDFLLRVAPPGGRRRAARMVLAASISAVILALGPTRLAPIIITGGILLAALAAGVGRRVWRLALAGGILVALVAELHASIPVNDQMLPYQDNDYLGLYSLRPALEHARNLSDGGRIVIEELWGNVVTAPKLGMLLRIPVFEDYEPLLPEGYADWEAHMSGRRPPVGQRGYMGNVLFLSFPDFNPRFLDYAGVTHVLLTVSDPGTARIPSVDGMRYVKEFPLSPAWTIGAWDETSPVFFTARLYRNPYAWPRAFLARRVERVKSGRDTLTALASLPRGTPPSAFVQAPSSEPLPAGGENPGEARIARSDPEEVIVEVSASREALLVLSDTYFPGWKADVDGRPATILRANHVFRAVRVPAGAHRVTFRYDPWSVKAGYALGAAGLLGCAAVALRRGSPKEGA